MKTQSINDSSLWELWDGTEGASSGSVYEGDLQEIHRAMGVCGRRRFAGRQWLAAAAVSVAILFIMAGEYFIIKRQAVSEDRVSYVTSPSAKGDFVLPDGSHVWLNSASSLSFDKSNPRQVVLEGEGFFDVCKKDGQPFTVSTGTVDVKVLGTRFNVRSSSHFEREEVSLVSGRVEIRSGENTMLLSPGEKAAIESGSITRERADVTFDCSWTGRELVFDNVALSDILVSLEHWYNVNITVAPEVPLSSRLSFKVRRETLAETQRIITRITGCHFKPLDENNIMITKR